ncbi:hypothetical protein B7R54_07080 [Subtercola boreus]|uniref:Ribonuclease VapC n=1 Tax=Subtercola boreus TaxID=120213 RepID=A0A3E0VH11_9MICO|nr:type II toxin-antitoxin system VapC family toxin [Subtercola boreus]RFA09011.1 hypothetical protein B7R54_07080 [Subtercola boreus]TQL53990.1 hypothetical protein FB464_1516 [Subtercola boreus]
MIILDTNVLSEPLRRSPDAAVIDWLERAAGEAAITSISVGEMLVGARQLPQGRRREALLAAIENIIVTFAHEILHYDTEAARIFAVLHERRATIGRPLSVEDGMIAAICVGAGAELATRNTKDFEGLGIALINPWGKS